MEQLARYAQSLEALLTRDRRYPSQAYGVMLAALNDTISRLPQPRHITGPELAEGFRRFVKEQFGPMTLTVLKRWNLHTTSDLGAVVFNLIEVGLLSKTPGDRPEDFEGLYAFEEAFGGPYQYVTPEP